MVLTKLFHQHQYGRTDLDISCPPHQPLWVSKEPFATKYKSYDPANAHTKDACWWEIYAVYQTGRRNHVVRQRKRKEIVKLNSLKKFFGKLFTFLGVHLHYLCFFHRNSWTPHYLQHSAFQTSAVQMYQEAVWIRWARLIADGQAPFRKEKEKTYGYVEYVCVYECISKDTLETEIGREAHLSHIHRAENEGSGNLSTNTLMHSCRPKMGQAFGWSLAQDLN